MTDNVGKFNKVLQHPDKEEIIRKLLDGESLKNVELWLRKKYPKRKQLHVSWVTLQKFRKEHLNLYGEVLEDIKNTRKAKDDETSEAYIKQVIAKSSHYQEKINEIASKELDASKQLIEMNALVEDRLKYYYNFMASGQGSIKEDKVFLEYLKEYRAILESWKKFIEGHVDKKIEHNININVVNEQINVLKGAIFDILREIDPSLVPVFVDRLNKKIEYVNIGTNEYKQLSVIDAEDFDD